MNILRNAMILNRGKQFYNLNDLEPLKAFTNDILPLNGKRIESFCSSSFPFISGNKSGILVGNEHRLSKAEKSSFSNHSSQVEIRKIKYGGRC